MTRSASRLLFAHAVFLGGGTLVGWLYERPELGLLAAALIALAWHLRQLLLFERSLRDRKFEKLRYGEGIWSQMWSRIAHLRNRNKVHKKRYATLIKEFRKSANAMPDGGIILNDNFEIVLCNSAVQDLAGIRRRKDRGQRIDNLLRAPAFGRYLRGELETDAVEIPSPVNEGNWLSCRIVPYGAEQRLLLIRDVTGRRRMSRIRREFVANASHELRSPLTVISGYLDTMVADPAVPAEWRGPLDQMQEQSLRMNKIITELLELSRLESAGAAPDDELVDVAGLLAAARKSLAGRKGVPDIVVAIDTQARLHGSSAEIESIISNLLSNAVRHSRADGEVTLRWSGTEGGADLTVSDNGIGIEPEHLPRLTERFFRVDQGRDRGDGGVGLGLAIVKHALERHGATLEVRSTPNEGSEFICHFPAERLAMADAIPIVRDSAAG